MRRFSILTLMGFVFVAAIGLAALRNANELWAGAMLTIVFLAIASAVMGALIVTAVTTLGGSLNTAYTHLRHLREKTGCSRMPELIRKLNEVQVPLRLS